MAATNETGAPRDRRLLLAGLLLLAVAAGVGFGRVFLGAAPSARLAAAGLVATAIAAVLWRRSLPISLLASAVGLLLFVGLVLFRETTWYGLPTPDTVAAALRVLSTLPEHAAREVAPAPPLPSLLMAGIIAVWTASTAAHGLATRAASPVLALLPPAAVAAFAGVVRDDGPRPLYVGLFLVAGMMVLFGSASMRVRAWGPVAGRRGRRTPSSVAGSWARGLGAAAVGVAVAVPGILPGFEGQPIVEITGRGGERISVSPIVDIRPSLLQNPPATLFRVRAERAAYWRFMSLDAFNGLYWSSSDPDASAGSVVSGSARLPTGSGEREELLQEIEIDRLGQQWLPAAFEPIEVELPIGQAGGAAYHDDDLEALVRRDGTRPGYRYTVVSSLTAPSRRELDSVQDLGRFDQVNRYTQLPPDLPPRIGEIARELSAGAGTPFRKIMAIQAHLRTFTYDELAPAGHGANHVVNFLEQTRRGFCEQFAGTMAVLVRSLGYPARVSLGFLPGARGDDGRWTVSTRDTHAWVEVHFPGYGWIAFEPTPTRANPVARPYLDPAAGVISDGPTGSGTRRDEAPISALGGLAQREQFESRPPAGGDAAPATPPQETPWGRLGMAALLLVVLAAVGMPAGKALLRSLALRRASTPRSRVVAAWRSFEGRAADLGLGRNTGETLAEYAHRMASRAPPDDLGRLASAASVAIYSDSAVDRETASGAVTSARALSRALSRRVGMWRAAAGAVRPSLPPSA